MDGYMVGWVNEQMNLFSTYIFNSYCMPGTMQNAEDPKVNTISMFPLFMRPKVYLDSKEGKNKYHNYE